MVGHAAMFGCDARTVMLVTAVALVLVIEAGGASRFHRDRPPRFGHQLLGGLVQANQWTIAVVWPCMDGQHVFHGGYERAVRLRQDNPALSAMGLEDVFLSARPIVEPLGVTVTVHSINPAIRREASRQRGPKPMDE